MIGEDLLNDILFCGSILPRKPIRDLVDFAKQVEFVGGDLLFVADENPTPPYRDVWGVLHSIARNTHRIKLGTAIIPILARHPAHVAVQLSTLAEVTGENRVVLGIGVGGDWTLKPIGKEIGRTNLVGMMREATQIFRTLFAGNTVDSHHDKLEYFTIHDLKLIPYPANLPKIYFGVRGPKLLQLAGQLADGVLNTLPLGLVPKTLELIKKGAKKSGRNIHDIRLYTRLGIIVGKTPQDAFEFARKIVPLFFRRPYNPELNEFNISPLDVERLQNAMKKDGISAHRFVTDEMVNQCAITGTPSEVIDKIDFAQKIGVNHFAIHESWGPDIAFAKKMLKEKIIPTFK
jgi:5,10-methylenetetrahydromethanopterin reductase